ncbi:family 1 glycosylhydrolase [Actinacidiphila sp. ITFR-21]|uniref:family 1 glycosylhydrolase n=1 Tax=Actinacidiphila sp. ITFR-21 TaxID=3075199 RepID=UPI00288B7101|nr:family 1 glycosylhydrolase [Streptomyces sp. ITFR-21]WNI18034.1 family 1 glycosylhydrolase [Streptomyces sp. ITFR-21]
MTSAEDPPCPISSEGLTDLLRVQREYPAAPLAIAENGGAFPDTVRDVEGGRVQDDRIAFLSSHIDAVADACAQGADVRGYFVWTSLDNFEWAHGYGPAFGLVPVDRESMKRTPKKSALWFGDFLRGRHTADQSGTAPHTP